MLPLEGTLVVAIEQAVAAPLCTARLCEAGARVIKIERKGGDFARGYDEVAGGDSSYFAWLNQNKESLILDFKDTEDSKLLRQILNKADVLVQNLGPGALKRAGFGSDDLRKQYPRLITCDISGYGEGPETSHLKAYDFLVQGESGLVSISGGEDMGRIGVSLCDIGAGMAAHAGVLEALLLRNQTGTGSSVKVSLFGVAADWMTVPLLHHDYGGKSPKRVGLHHPSIAPYGGYPTLNGDVVILAIQNEREWQRFCEQVLLQPDLTKNSLFESNNARVSNRGALDECIHKVTTKLDREEFISRLVEADIAYGAVNSVKDFSGHPALERRTIHASSGNSVEIPARPIRHTEINTSNASSASGKAPEIGEHSNTIRKEFASD